MTYQWKMPGIFHVSAQTAGEELNRIYQRDGEISLLAIVEDSRPKTAPLHACFEWRDKVAAEKYRETQAAQIVRSIVIVDDEKEQKPAIRAFVHVENSYHPMDIVVKSESKYEDLLLSALADLRAYKNKYAVLADTKALQAVFQAIDQIPA